MTKSIILFTNLILFASLLYAQDKEVLVLTLDGAINPASSSYIEAGIEKAVEINAECLVLFLNTPGGLLKSTRVIVSEFLQSPVPIIVFVYPSGSHAASAGVFITMSAHIAVMAPGTNIGAAHPVNMQGGQDSTMSEKATNDAAAFIRTISEKRNRNIKWGEDAVRKSLALTETEALKINVIDYIAKDVNELLNIIDGQEIETENEKEILQTADAKIVNFEMTFQQVLLNILSDPNIAYFLLMLGFYGILFELYSPGSIFPGVLGGICLILGLYSLHTLPVNYAGLALIIFAIILFVLEIKTTSHGILTVGGTLSLILGSIMLIDVESALEFVEISREVIATIVIITVLFFVFAIGLGIKAQRRKPTTGYEGIINETGVATTNLKPNGQVRVHGEIWEAESLEGKIKSGEKIVVKSISGLKLKVVKS